MRLEGRRFRRCPGKIWRFVHANCICRDCDDDRLDAESTKGVALYEAIDRLRPQSNADLKLMPVLMLLQGFNLCAQQWRKPERVGNVVAFRRR